jgi:phosphocarrier protein FPr
MSEIFHGIPAAPGVGIGAAAIYHTGHFAIEGADEPAHHDPEREWWRFQSAQRQVDEELERLIRSSSALVMEIFSAHRVILQDSALLASVREAIFDQGRSAVVATFQVISDLAALFRELEDEYFASRTADILDIGQRLLAQLGAAPRRIRLDVLPQDTILIADDLTPSDVAQLEPSQVLGIALVGGAPTAHTAILARSLGIPMVCGLEDRVLRIQPRQPAILDGSRGLLLLHPDQTMRRRYHAARQSLIEERALAARHAHEPAQMSEGVCIPVLANANSPEDVLHALDYGADGIGLLRTEYLFQERPTPPSLEEQIETYSRFIHQVDGRQLTVRALDAGGDKPVQYFPHPRENNPFLGLRGVRLLISQPDILRTQYRALQLSVRQTPGCGEARFMLPMITTVEEVRAVRAILNELDRDLPPLKLGVMIEVPSAALVASHLTVLVDFFSIGTNDLAQYTLASDRTHRTVGALADPLHPSVLRLIEMTCAAGRRGGIPVSLCGELAGDMRATPLLLGLGLNELSAPLPAVALVKAAVRRSQLERCQVLAQAALGCDSADSVRSLLQAEE